MPISPEFNSIFSKNWDINFTQCLPSGHLKYTELCTILQMTASAHSELGGISFSDMQEFNQAWVLSRMRVEIVDLPKWKDTITVRTWINTLQNSRSVRAFELYVNGNKIVGCETFWAVFNTQTRRPETLALPNEHFELYPETIATTKPLSKINLKSDSHLIATRTVSISDIDNVNHVNNIKYLEWCLDQIDAQLILNQKIKSIEMNFIKELSLNDEVTIFRDKSVNAIVFNVTKNDKTCYALQLDV